MLARFSELEVAFSPMVATVTCWCLLCLLLHLPHFSAALSNAEGMALIQVKTTLIDQTNQLNSWSSDLVSPCTWAHVSCNDDQYVTSVMLAGLDLAGSLSGEMGKLSKLQTLTLQDNRFSGSLPMELGKLSRLETLNAEKNAFNGSIPSSWSALANLKYLILDNNQLSGAIPPSITEIPNLLSLDLSYNEFTGQIPDAAFKLQYFNFIGNHLACGSSGMKPCQSSNFSTPSAEGNTNKVSKGKIMGGVFGAVTFICSAAVVIVLCERGRRRLIKLESFVDVPAEDELKIALGQLKRFTLRELQLATNNFSAQNVIGQGAFGKVYKGILDDSTEVAVKRLLSINVEGGEEAFLQEVEMISVAVHRNLLQLIGFCITPSERILVYPYMSNKSVAYCLRERRLREPVLDWNTRKKIALGAARGLEYLHDHCNPKIIHRDVKAANILLTGDYEAVVGDFGLAKLMDTRNTHVTTMVRGTMGHIAPEYLSTGRSSEKTDVFGYGVMLLELVTGQRAIELSRLQEEHDVLLLDHVKNLQHEKRLDSLVDPSLVQYDAQQVEQLIQVALLCTQASPEERPKMAEVVRMLAGEGLAERWEEWQQVEIIRRQETDVFSHGFESWAEDSTVNQEAIELSAAR